MAPSAFLAVVFLWLPSVVFVPCLNCVRISSNLQSRCNRNIGKDGGMLTLGVEQLERNKGGGVRQQYTAVPKSFVMKPLIQKERSARYDILCRKSQPLCSVPFVPQAKLTRPQFTGPAFARVCGQGSNLRPRFAIQMRSEWAQFRSNRCAIRLNCIRIGKNILMCLHSLPIPYHYQYPDSMSICQSWTNPSILEQSWTNLMPILWDWQIDDGLTAFFRDWHRIVGLADFPRIDIGLAD